MPNIMVVLREEIARLARKEIKLQTEALRKASTEQRKKLAEMKRQISALERQVKSLEKKGPRKVLPKDEEGDAGTFRFSARGLRSNRKRLGLSAADFGKLVGVTGQTVYKWEQEATRPRPQQVAALAAVRGMGKKEARARLEELPKEDQ